MTECECFFDVYENIISPTLKEIDILLKSHRPLTVSKTSSLLDITPEEVKTQMDSKNISHIDTCTFIHIMINGSSYICRLLKRQLECGIKDTYTWEDISYIYGISSKKTREAFEFLGIEKAHTDMLPLIFLQIR